MLTRFCCPTAESTIVNLGILYQVSTEDNMCTPPLLPPSLWIGTDSETSLKRKQAQLIEHNVMETLSTKAVQRFRHIPSHSRETLQSGKTCFKAHVLDVEQTLSELAQHFQSVQCLNESQCLQNLSFKEDLVYKSRKNCLVD